MKNVLMIFVGLVVCGCTPMWTPTFLDPKPAKIGYMTDASADKEIAVYQKEAEGQQEFGQEILRQVLPADMVKSIGPEISGYTTESCKENARELVGKLSPIIRDRSTDFCKISLDSPSWYSLDQDTQNRIGVYTASCVCKNKVSFVNYPDGRLLGTYNPSTGHASPEVEAIVKFMMLYSGNGMVSPREQQKIDDEQELRDWIHGRTNKILFPQLQTQ